MPDKDVKLAESFAEHIVEDYPETLSAKMVANIITDMEQLGETTFDGKVVGVFPDRSALVLNLEGHAMNIMVCKDIPEAIVARAEAGHA